MAPVAVEPKTAAEMEGEAALRIEIMRMHAALEARLENGQGVFHLALKEEFSEVQSETVTLNMKTFLPALSLFLGMSGLLGGALVKMYSDKKDKELTTLIENMQEENRTEIKDMRAEHTEMMWLGLRRASANIYSGLSNDSESLYRYLEPARKGQKHEDLTKAQKLYKNYLDLACDLAEKAYYSARKLRDSFSLRPDDLLRSYDKKLIQECLNNYIFYLSSRSTVQDKKDVSAVLKKFERGIKQEGELDSLGALNHKATLVWAELNLDYITREEAVEHMHLLFQQEKSSKAWQDDMVEELKLYDVVNNLNSGEQTYPDIIEP